MEPYELFELGGIKIVYVLTNRANGKKYVGSSYHPYYRKKAHDLALKGHRHPCENMQTDYDKYGDCFDMTIVDLVTQPREKSEEYKWMKKLKTYDERYGYNYADIVMNPIRKAAGLSFKISQRKGRKYPKEEG